MNPARHVGSERGAILVHVAIALVGLIAFSVFVIDYGVLWVSRRQAQNAADAGAMAGAISMGFIDMNDQARARQAAIDAVLQNWVWGEPPDIQPEDVTFPECPAGSPGAGTNACIRVNVYRNQERNNALPTIFGPMVGVDAQGVRATATAEVMFGDSTNCVKPFAIADRWAERRPEIGPWDELDTFERYVQNGSNRGALLNPADYYEPPNCTGICEIGDGIGTGFTRQPDGTYGSDEGLPIILKAGNPNDAIAPGWFHPVVINPLEGPGGDNYRDNIATCDPTVIGPGTVLEVEPGNMIGPTAQGIRALIAQDPDAEWDTEANTIRGGCTESGTCPDGRSPRLVAVPVFNPDAYDAGRASGRIEIDIVKIVGFFIEGMVNGNDVLGYLTSYPAAPMGTGGTPGTTFVVSIALVR